MRSRQEVACWTTLLERLNRLMGVNSEKMAVTNSPKSPGLSRPLATLFVPT